MTKREGIEIGLILKKGDDHRIKTLCACLPIGLLVKFSKMYYIIVTSFLGQR